jgi:hypothetical protein
MTIEKTVEPALNDFIDAEQFKKDLSFNLADLTTAMQKHSGFYAHYAGQAVRAKRQYDIQVKKLEILESRLDREYRASFKERAEKVTEPQIRSSIVTDSRYIAASLREINARSIYDLCRSCERSFDQQKDLLLQIARDAAREGAGNLRVVANQTSRERIMEAMKHNAAGAEPAA